MIQTSITYYDTLDDVKDHRALLTGAIAGAQAHCGILTQLIDKYENAPSNDPTPETAADNDTTEKPNARELCARELPKGFTPRLAAPTGQDRLTAPRFNLGNVAGLLQKIGPVAQELATIAAAISEAASAFNTSPAVATGNIPAGKPLGA